MASSFIEKRCSSRFAVVQALFQWQYTGSSAEDVCHEFVTHYLKESWYPHHVHPDTRFFKKLFLQTTKASEELDAAITPILTSRWSLKKLDPVLHALLRAAIYELMFTPLSPATIINAYVDLTHLFLSSDEAGFLNASLQAIEKQRQPHRSKIE